MKQTEPFIMGRPGTWLSLMLRNRAPELRYIKRAGTILAASALSVPFRLYERIVHSSALQNAAINKPPVFIIGFWRSGTTYLHNLLCSNSRFGYLSLLQTLAPDFFLTAGPLLRLLTEKKIPPTRPMDNMALSLDSPQEDELAICNMSEQSLYYQLFFPKNAMVFFDRYVMMDSLTSEEKKAWCNTYHGFLKKLTYSCGGSRLILKNPAHTARVKLLLKMYPEAKFIHIYRNPYVVYMSCLNMFEKLMPSCQLQTVDHEKVENYILEIYRRMMLKFLKDREGIPAENLIEICFEDFERAPLVWMERIYRRFKLENYHEALPMMEKHLVAQAGYKKNTFGLSGEVIERLNAKWLQVFQFLGYNTLKGEAR